MAGDAARYAMHVKRAEARRRALKKNTLTATETGAKLNAIKNYAKTPGISSYAKRAAKTPTPKGATPQFRKVETRDIEDMIKRGG